MRVFRGKLAEHVGFDSNLPQVGPWCQKRWNVLLCAISDCCEIDPTSSVAFQ